MRPLHAQPFASSNTMQLLPRYLTRLGLAPDAVTSPVTLETLQLLQEAHLDKIPFENTAQHGVLGGLPTLDLEDTATKILHDCRGGFCFEVNALFGALLEEVGFEVVARVAAFVLDDQGSHTATVPSHLIFIVAIQGKRYLVDVGFGEPPLHPLEYVFDAEQRTPEGMVSKLVCDDDDGDVRLLWKKDGEWKARQKWKNVDADRKRPLVSFTDNLSVAFSPTSHFAQKLIACRVNRTHKYTLAGDVYKVTTPRFGVDSKQTEYKFDSADHARVLLRDVFGEPWKSTTGLELETSRRNARR